MFIHLLAGGLVFFIYGKTFDIEITRIFLIIGASWGLASDQISYILSRVVKFNKWSHLHRDNFSHSIFMPFVMLVFMIFFDFKMAIAISIVMLTHPFLDLFGIGWGVKLFYPLSKKTYKMFYKGQFLIVWDQKEVNAEVEKFGDDNWIKNTYFKPNIIGISEWLSLVGFLLLVIVH